MREWSKACCFKKNAFTLIEFLLIIAIVSTVATFAMLAIGSSTGSAYERSVESRQKIIQEAITRAKLNGDTFEFFQLPDETPEDALRRVVLHLIEEGYFLNVSSHQ